MTERNDQELVAEFAQRGSEEAFATLVARYVNLVHSAALRFAGNPHDAEEITQAVFIILARKAGSLRRDTILPGWLYQTARLTAANFVKIENRRRRREQEAYMQSTLNESDAMAWEQIAPLLDEAMGRLGETDRNAVVLRFFENRTAQEVGSALRLSEAAAHKRVNRALEKLRKFLSQRGVALTAALLAGAVSSNAVQAAPSPLALSAAAAGLGKVAISASAGFSVKATLLRLLWPKLQAALGVALGLSLAGGGLLLKQSRHRPAASLHKTVRLPASTNTSQRIPSGTSVIRINLEGTPGLPFEVAYSADGPPQSAKGVLPGEVSFNADAFSATIDVQGPGEFGFEVHRGELQQASAGVARIETSRSVVIEGRKGGTGISVRGKSK